MNKLLIGLLSGALLVMPVWADDDDAVDTEITEEIEEEVEDVEEPTPAVGVRMDCPTMKTKISELSAIAEPDDDTVSELTNLQNTYRSKCSIKTSGRARAKRVGSGMASTTPTTDRASSTKLSDEQKNMCELLNSAIAQEQSEENKKVLQDNYQQYCVDKKIALDNIISMYTVMLTPVPVSAPQEADVVVERPDTENMTPISEPKKTMTPEKTGPCQDGTNPNRFGCCTGEKFKDLGDGVFACCPDSGGDCFPPIGVLQ